MDGGDVLPLSPNDAFAAGRYTPMPVIQGTTKDEGTLFSYLFTVTGKLRSDAKIGSMLDDSFHASTAAIRAEYGAVVNDSRWQATAQVVTDSRFACPALRMDRLLAGSSAPLWAYEFDDPAAPYALPLFFLPRLGAYHASEIAYVFQRPWVLSGRFQFTPAQQDISDRMQDYWGRFARTGDPNGGDAMPWPRYAAGDEPTPLAVDAAPEGQASFALRHHCAFWNRLGY